MKTFVIIAAIACIVVFILRKFFQKDGKERSACPACGKLYGGTPRNCPYCGETLRWKSPH